MNIGLFVLFVVAVVAIVTYTIIMLKKGGIRLIHMLYFATIAAIVVSLSALTVLMFLTGNKTAEYVIDSISNVGLFMPVLVLCVSLAFIKGWEKAPRWLPLLFIIPLLSFILVWTNPLHGLFYEVFSINRAEIKFGPYFFVNGVYSYICFTLSVVFLILFATKRKNAAYRKQAIMFAIGNAIPMVVNILAIFSMFNLDIYSTPLAYSIGIIIFHGLAIFRFNLLDIRPLAMETILNRISDCYLVVNEKGVVISHNNAFANTFGREYDLKMHSDIFARAAESDLSADVGIHTLITSMTSCRGAEGTISYEQSLTIKEDEDIAIKYYMIDITSLNVNGKNVGFVVFFKDITKLKENDRELHNSYTRLMEHKQLAFLGQMLGGISHNLKTPIMSISGSCSAIGNLVDEAASSLGDPDVTKEDYTEIYSEVTQWVSKIQEACSYMSDIITAVKGQATNFNTGSVIEFSIEDVVKRVTLLLRHEFINSKCVLRVDNLTEKNVRIYGDINSMVQVVNNLVSNAIYAMKEKGGEIILEADTDDKNFMIKVKDCGTGVPEYVKKDLFHQMVTSKGAMGSGLGIFMSKTVIKARFDGTMWFEDNPGGGAVFVISIPLSKVQMTDISREG